MPPASIHLAASGSALKLPAGPMMSPSAGPTLQIAVAAPETAVMKSSPNAPSPTARAPKQTMKTKKKPSTELMTSSGIGRRL